MNRTPVISSTPFSPSTNQEQNRSNNNTPNQNEDLKADQSLNTSVTSSKLKTPNLDDQAKRSTLSPIVPNYES